MRCCWPHAIRECLKDPKRTSQVTRIMADGHKELGTQTYDQHLEELIDTDQITEETREAALATTDQPIVRSKRARQA